MTVKALPVPTLTLSEKSVSGTAGQTIDMPTVTATDSNGSVINDLTYTYTSNDESVAKITADNKLQLVATGNATITVKSVATDTYGSGSAHIAVTVTGKTILTEGFNWKRGDVVVSGDFVTPEEAKSLTFPKFKLPATATGGDVTYSSNNEAIATVSNDGVITLTDGAKGGSAVIKATWSGNDEYNASTATYTLLVTKDDTTPAVALPFENEFKKNQVITLQLKNFTLEDCNFNTDKYAIVFNTSDDKAMALPSKHASNGWYDLNNSANITYLRGIPLVDANGDNSIRVRVNVYETTDRTVVYSTEKTFKLIDHDAIPVPPTIHLSNVHNDADKNISGSDANVATKTIHYTTDEAIALTGSESTSIVYGKFSSESGGYSAQQILNELTSTSGQGSIGVYSSEVYSSGTKKLRYLSGFQIVNGIISNEESDILGYYYILPRTPVNINANPSYKQIEISDKTQENNYGFTEPAITYTYSDTDDSGNAIQSDVTDSEWLESVRFSSSNTEIATVNETTGEVTLKGKTGTVVITIKSGKTDNFAEETGSYSISITDKDKAVPPTISPDSKYYSEAFNATITAPANTATAKYVTLYVIEREGEEAKTLDPSNPSNGNVVKGGSSATISIDALTKGATYTIRAITYEVDGDGNYINNGNVSVESKVKFTYKYVDVPEPVLTPGILGKEYVFTNKDTNFKEDANYTKMGGYLSVEATIPGATDGTVVYYTINSASDVVTTADKKYDGLNKIKLDQSAIIRAIAVDPDGNKSDVVTYRYNYNGAHFTKPYFVVTGEGAGEYHEYSTVDINTSSTIELKTTANDGVTYTLYYTLDGSEPTGRANAYSDPFSLVASATVKVMAVGDEGSVSEVASCKFNITTNGQLWIANDDTCLGGTLGVNEGKSEAIIKKTPDYKYGVEYITATFGGINNTDDESKTTWKDSPNGANDAPNEGAKVDGVGVYDLSTSTDIFDEVSAAIVHENEALAKTHERTFKLPAKGTYMKFEPERDGNLYIYVFQNGGVVYDRKISTTDYFSRHFITMRPVYLVDEAGITQPIDEEKTKSNGILDSHWKDYVSGGFSEKGETIDGKTQTMFTSEQQGKIFEIYKTHLSGKGAEAGVTGIKPFNIYDAQHKANAEAVFGKGPENENSYAYATVSAASVRYVFPVKAGKTYFFYSDRSKIAIRGFGFIPTISSGGTLDRQDVEIDEAADNTDALTQAVNANKTAKVTLKRNFKADTWTSIVLPFSVSNAMLKKVFGKDTKVIHFNRIDEDKNILYQMKHYHQMLVAGTPAIIKPSETVTDPVFDGVQVTKTDVDDVIGDETYKTKGSYNNGTDIAKWSFYINNIGVWKQLSATGMKQIGTRAWIEGASAQMAIQVDGGFDDGETTGIYEITVDDDNNIGSRTNANGKIYNLNGQCVGNENTDINSLANGIYMINGKKIVVNNK
ncbi:MAG: chitobiase/beta-hexosaminidase C-terminal domain-containing protein [Paraprevotella sp.]|nr:chitobiase/beta-hexosaminidase C-terminal domain-containing protein [Paraprevotella sp.]